MRYPYYNPNITISVFLKSLFISTNRARQIITGYYKKLTGKKYILITNSCRSALYLAYQSIDKKGEVITSPLTCKVAINPIEESNNIPVFADINIGDLNINTNDIEHRITSNTVAIQAIHLGGISCNMGLINNIAKKNKLWVIEDCAQSLGAKYDGKNTGSFGDIACFSLIKNAYGIGGGILATNSKEIFDNATSINSQFKSISWFLTIYRIIRKLIETYRVNFIGKFLFGLLMKFRGEKSSYSSIKGQLNQIGSCALKISAHQTSRLSKLHLYRKFVGETYYKLLNEKALLINNQYDPKDSSFTKFFIYNPDIDTKRDLKTLHDEGFECMHLEHKTESPYQEMIISKQFANKNHLKNYLRVHDSILSLPLYEQLNKKDIELIVKKVYK